MCLIGPLVKNLVCLEKKSIFYWLQSCIVMYKTLESIARRIIKFNNYMFQISPLTIWHGLVREFHILEEKQPFREFFGRKMSIFEEKIAFWRFERHIVRAMLKSFISVKDRVFKHYHECPLPNCPRELTAKGSERQMY